MADEILFHRRNTMVRRPQKLAAHLVEDDRGGEDRSLWTMHPDGSQAKQLLDYKGTAHDGLDWSPDGKSIIYSALADGRLQLFDVSYRGGAPHLLSRDSANLLHPKISPDGKWITCTRLVQSKQIWRRPLNCSCVAAASFRWQ
jgi:Tol biopolymer transport system component